MDSSLDKEENRFVENLHPEAWGKIHNMGEKIENMEYGEKV